jgi:hypothetical protein
MLYISEHLHRYEFREKWTCLRDKKNTVDLEIAEHNLSVNNFAAVFIVLTDIISDEFRENTAGVGTSTL